MKKSSDRDLIEKLTISYGIEFFSSLPEEFGWIPLSVESVGNSVATIYSIYRPITNRVSCFVLGYRHSDGEGSAICYDSYAEAEEVIKRDKFIAERFKRNFNGS